MNTVRWARRDGLGAPGVGLLLLAEEGGEIEVFAVEDVGAFAFEAAAGGGVEGELALGSGGFDAEFGKLFGTADQVAAAGF